LHVGGLLVDMLKKLNKIHGALTATLTLFLLGLSGLGFTRTRLKSCWI